MGWEIALIAGSTVMGAAQQIQAGRQRQRQEEIKQRQLRADQQQARIQSMQEELVETKDFRRNQARNIALAAAKGFDFAKSGSFLAIKDDSEEAFESDLSNIRLFGKSREANASNSILASKAAASAAKTNARFGAINTLFSGATKINQVA